MFQSISFVRGSERHCVLWHFLCFSMTKKCYSHIYSHSSPAGLVIVGMNAETIITDSASQSLTQRMWPSFLKTIRTVCLNINSGLPMALYEGKLHSLSWLLYLVVNDFSLPLLVFERQALPVIDFLIFRGEFRHHLCVHGGDLWKQMGIRAVLRDTKPVHLHLLLQFCPDTTPQTDHRLRAHGVCPHLTQGQ